MIVKKEQLNYVPGVVPGLGMAINAFTKPGGKIMITPPVYHPFARLISRYDRRLVNCPLILENGHYRIDLTKFRREIKGVRVFILCNPHNPGGVVWTHDELKVIADICAEDNVIVFSDEIHADLTLPPYKHVPFAMISEHARNNSVTFMAPSKAFELDGGHLFVYPAVEAAYSNGTEWLDQCLAYIQKNIDYVDEYLKNHTPKIKAMRPMASYLVWLDCRELGLTQKELNAFFVDEAHLALNDGEMFGKEGIGFMRMNIGCPRSVVEQAMHQLEVAYKKRF